MWLVLSITSALFLGVYDFTKRQALRKNGVLWVLFVVTLLSTLLLVPFFRLGPAQHFLILAPKALVVTISWVAGLKALTTLPLSTASTMKASRPIIVVGMSVILFKESLNLWQWAGVVLTIVALYSLSHSSKKEGIYFTKSKGVFWMALSILTGAASALYDKYVMKTLDPLFVQCWSNLFITFLLGIVLLGKAMKDGPANREHFKWDWMLLLTAVLIVLADASYFFAVKSEGSLLSVISLLRRGSVIITFCLAAAIIKEGHIKEKAFSLGLMLVSMILLLYGSSL